jgi:hypothetical protein
MKNTYKSLLIVGITFAVLFALQASAAVGTNIVGNGYSPATNNMVTTNMSSTMSSVNDTNMVSNVYAYFTKSAIDTVTQKQADEHFFGVCWMDNVMRSLYFNSIVTEGVGVFGIDTAKIPILEIRKRLSFGPFYNAKYPMSSVGPMTDVTSIGFAIWKDL